MLRTLLRDVARLRGSWTSPCHVPSVSMSSSTIFRDQKVNVNGVELNCVRGGEGAHVVLLLPGAMGSAWTDFTPQLNGLDPKLFSLVAWDPPGYGKSIPPYRTFTLDFLEKDADTALLLMRALDIKKFSLLGWSDGGISSMFLAAKYPEYVKKMVIWGANSYVLNTEMAAFKAIKDVRKWSKRMREPLEKLYGEEYLVQMWAQWCDTMQGICDERRGNICREQLTNIKCPTFILYGSKDTLVHPEHVSILRANIANATSHIYEEGGHNLHLKYAVDFNKRVTAFLTNN